MSNMETIIKISVRNLVEFALKSGSIDSGFASMKTAVEGTKGHKYVQKLRIDQNEQYLSEVSVSLFAYGNGVSLEIGGRIDGIMINGTEYMIEEIKTTERSLELMEESHNEVHWAQAICYAYIYANQNEIQQLGIQLTYYHRSLKTIKSFQRTYEYQQLQEYFLELVGKYMRWAERTADWNRIRQQSIEQAEFPFEQYRGGQREFAVAVYKTITSRRRIFAKAPTGIGKTIAAIFPTVKAIGEGHLSKLFYLTAKTSTRYLAEEAFENLRRHGLAFRTVTITAKEKMCAHPQGMISCKAEDCPYADGYYDRVDGAIEEILQYQNYSRDLVYEHALLHKVCPFEYSLDLSLFCDGIICDYNYVFDPRVYLKRFFTDVKEDYGILVDEAHNLVDRAREMYSAELMKSKFLELKNHVDSDSKELKKSLNSINSFFIKLRKDLETADVDYVVNKEAYDEMTYYLEEFLEIAERQLSAKPQPVYTELLLALYFESMNYLRTLEGFDEKYVCYVEHHSQDVKLKLFCLDPSTLLDEAMKRGSSTVLFSATFSPLDYFRSILGGSQQDYKLSIRSPFDQHNMCLLAADNINTTYKVREMSYQRVSDYIHLVVESKKGNYFVFFPSYKYLNSVYEVFVKNHPEVDTLIQRNDMSEQDREGYLNQFGTEEGKAVVGFAVLGGAFGEGIDLVGNRLIGAIVVGVGLPQLCLERDIIKQYFDEVGDQGFEYAYSYPGMNKVLQAAGRVIRTETDRGVVFLIDQRFRRNEYQALMPPEWDNLIWVKNSDMVKEELNNFWRIV